MAIVTEISWDDIVDGKALPETPARKVWRQAVAEIADKAKAKLPECSGRVDSAVKIVLAGDVELLTDGTAKVASQSNGTTAYHVVNGHCDCKDYPKAPHSFCKHRLGAAIARRAHELVKAKLADTSPVKVTLPLSVCYTPGLQHTRAGGGHHAGQSVRTFCGKKSHLRYGTWHAGTRPGRRPTRCLVCPDRPEAVHPHGVVFDRL